MGRCQGDCDIDADCAAGLTCYDRAGDEIVPGCTGFGGTTWDYCYDPNDTDKDLSVIGPEGTVWSYFELTQCQGGKHNRHENGPENPNPAHIPDFTPLLSSYLIVNRLRL